MEISTTFGMVPVDISFGGAFYASVDLDQMDLSATTGGLDDLISLGRQIRTALDNSPAVVHAPDDRLSGLSRSSLTARWTGHRVARVPQRAWPFSIRPAS